MDINVLIERAEIAKKTHLENGGEVIVDINYEKPISEDKLIVIEKEIGFRLPETYRYVLLNVASKFEYFSIFEFKGELDKIGSAALSWDINDIYENVEHMENLNEIYQDHMEDDEFMEFGKGFLNILPFAETGGGDYVSFNLKVDGEPSIVCTPHDFPEYLDFKVADNFLDFIDKVSLLGFVGDEAYDYEAFTTSSNSGLDLETTLAKKYLKKLGHTE